MFALRHRISHLSSPLRFRLLSSLAVLEQRDGTLQKGSLSAVTAARRLGEDVTAFVAGRDVTKVAEQAARVDGVKRVVVVENEDYEKVNGFFFQAPFLSKDVTEDSETG